MTDLALRYRHLALSLGPRGTGALVAGLISVAWAAVGALAAVVVPDLGLVLVVPALSAALVVAGLGWLLGERAVERRSFGPMVALAVLAVLLNALLIAFFLALNSSRDLFELVVLLLLAFAYGLVIFGLPALVIALLSAYAWLRLLLAAFPDATRAAGR